MTEQPAAWGPDATPEQEVAYLRDRLDRTEAELEQAHGERDELAQKVARVEALLFRHYTGSPGGVATPEHVREIDALADLYSEDLADDLRAALRGATDD